MNAESAKRSKQRVGIHRREAESARREPQRNKRVRDNYKVEGKDQWEAAAVLAVVGTKISYGIYQDLKGTPAPHGQIASCNVKR